MSHQQLNLILSAERLTLSRGARRIYEDLNISFGPGITAILGPNGAGKTTLIEGLLQPSQAGEGLIRLDGAEVGDRTSLRRFFARVGHMPQQWRYFSSFTARECVEYTAWLKNIPSRRVRAAAIAALAWVDLSDQATTRVRNLSGGMQQRVGLAEAFVNDPRAVLLDEPTVGLDPAQRASFRRFIRSRSTDRAIILSTHLTDDVEAIADRVIVISMGQIAFDGSPTELAALAEETQGAASALEAGYLSVVGLAAREEGEG